MIQALKEIFSDYAALFWKHWILGAIIITAAFVGLNIELFYLYRGELFYTDTDCYTRALRITDWLQNFEWSEKIFPYFNPPHGFVLHFTRICDVIWLIFTLPFLPFLPIKEAVFYGGMFFSPLFMALALVALLWGLKPYLPPLKNKSSAFLFTAVFCLFLLNKINSCFDFSRPDHHSMMCFIYCFCIATVLHNQIVNNLKLFFVSGILCGMGMWASSAIEGLFAVAVMLTVLSFNRIFYKHSANELVYYSLGLFVSVTFAWLVNPPYGGWTVVDINRLTVVHVTLTALMFLSFWALAQIKNNKIMVKITALTFSAVICAAIMLLIFGADNLLTSIYDPFVAKIFIPRIIEMMPITFTALEEPFMAFSLLMMIFLLCVKLYSKQFKINLLLFFIFALASAAFARRFLPYYVGAAVATLGYMLFCLIAAAQKSKFKKFLLIIYVVLPFCYFALYMPMHGYRKFKVMESPVLTDIFYAPKLMYTQQTDVVGGPYHTNIEGISDNYIMWFTTDEEKLKKLLKKHGVKSIYLDLNSASKFYRNPQKNTDKLYGKVMTGKDIYPWMIELDKGYYEIDYEKF